MQKMSKSLNRVALVQFDPTGRGLDENLEAVSERVEALRERADLIVFAEYALGGAGASDASVYQLTSAHLSRLETISERTRIVIGIVQANGSGKPYNSLVHFENGRVIAIHQKLYLVQAGVFSEASVFESGENYQTWNIAGIPVAPYLCNDSWYPGFVHLAQLNGAKLMLICAASPMQGLPAPQSTKESWRRLCRFYAEIYGCFVVFSNRIGTEANLDFWGGSEIISPQAQRVVGTDSNEPCDVIGELDWEKVTTAREALPTLSREKPTILKSLLEPYFAN